MARDYSKQQNYYEVTVYFKHSTKTYHLSNVEALEEFLSKADENDTVIHYMVISVSRFIYPNWKSDKFKNLYAEKDNG